MLTMIQSSNLGAGNRHIMNFLEIFLFLLQNSTADSSRGDRHVSCVYISDTRGAPGDPGLGQVLHLRLCVRYGYAARRCIYYVC